MRRSRSRRPMRRTRDCPSSFKRARNRPFTLRPGVPHDRRSSIPGNLDAILQTAAKVTPRVGGRFRDLVGLGDPVILLGAARFQRAPRCSASASRVAILRMPSGRVGPKPCRTCSACWAWDGPARPIRCRSLVPLSGSASKTHWNRRTAPSSWDSIVYERPGSTSRITQWRGSRSGKNVFPREPEAKGPSNWNRAGGVRPMCDVGQVLPHEGRLGRCVFGMFEQPGSARGHGPLARIRMTVVNGSR